MAKVEARGGGGGGGGGGLAHYLNLAIAVVGIYTCYLAYGIYQEQLYRENADGTTFSATAFVLFAQCATNAAVGAIGEVVVGTVFASTPPPAAAPSTAHAPTSDTKDKPPHHRHRHHGEVDMATVPFLNKLVSLPALRTAVVYVMAMYTSNEALGFVTYPTQALVKSCKMIPVMIGSIIVVGRRYSWLKYACVALMTVGITWFQFAGDKKKRKGVSGKSDEHDGLGGESMGLLLLGVSLALDGVAGPLQEELKKLKLSNMQQVMVNNVWAAALMLAIAVGLGQLQYAVTYLSLHPALWRSLALFSLTSAFGQIFVFWTIRTFDSLTFSTITTTRKFFTIVLSVLYYGNPLSRQQWGAVLTVFAGLALETLGGGDDRHGKQVDGGAAITHATHSAEGTHASDAESGGRGRAGQEHGVHRPSTPSSSTESSKRGARSSSRPSAGKAHRA